MNFSSGEGTGTAFHVTLPFAIDPTPTAVADNTADSIDLTGMQILLAEDQDGQEVVKHFAASAPGEIDLILMDVMMPVINVYKATRVIRQMSRPDAKTIPILAMSANAFSDDIRQSLAAGMNEHLSKPIEEGKLLTVIARLLGKDEKAVR